MRAFIAIDIDENEAIMRIIKEMSRQGVKIKAVEKENIHLTLKFLGEIDERQKELISHLMKDLTSYESFSISLQGIGAFPSVFRPKIIWIGVKYPDVLEKIWNTVEDIAEKAGIQRETRGFSPHITIGRVKDKNAWRLKDFLIKHKKDFFKEQKVGEIKLKKSVLTPSGPVYSDVASIMLK